MQNNGNTPTLNFAQQYDACLNDTFHRLQGLERIMARHNEIAKQDTTGLGDVQYRRVAELNKAARLIGQAIDGLIDVIDEYNDAQ